MQTVVTAARSQRSDYGLSRQKTQLYVCCSDAAPAAALAPLAADIATLATASNVDVLGPGQAAPPGCSVKIIDSTTTLHMVLKVRKAL